LVRLRNIPTTCKFLSTACLILSLQMWQAASVDLLSLKPFCSSTKILNFLRKDNCFQYFINLKE
jgi:hypothetical protein